MFPFQTNALHHIEIDLQQSSKQLKKNKVLEAFVEPKHRLSFVVVIQIKFNAIPTQLAQVGVFFRASC